MYKLLVARRLAEVGLTQEAVHYTEVIASTIMKQPSLYQQHFIQEVYDLGDMLKFSDPVYTSSESGGADPAWLHQLLPVLADYQVRKPDCRTLCDSWRLGEYFCVFKTKM